MNKIVLFIVACFFSASAWAHHFTVCDLQGDIAKNVVMLKNNNLTFEGALMTFERWFGIVSLEDAQTPEHRATMIAWMDRMIKQGGYEPWVAKVFVAYDDPAEAFKQERAACLAREAM